MSDKDYGVHKLSPADKKMPFHNGIVFATQHGWCVPNKEMHNDTELVVENRGLLERLEVAGYDKYGRALEGNPCGDLPRPRYVAECIANHCGCEATIPVVDNKQAEDAPKDDVKEDGKVPTVPDEEPENADEGAQEPTEQVTDEVKEGDEVETEETQKVEEVKTEEEPVVETKTDEPVKHTKEQLMDMNMNEVRAIGKTFDVADISKEKLADKIIEAQG